ncbi:MAG: DUF1720 domain-containing protein, partial [Lachnospiraceae bacterium]|nr:DUF1720 domain-containing protein [Lachnospiraceae bacterium]
DAGAAQPVNNMGFQPQDAGAAQPVNNNTGFQPQDAGAAQPVNNMGFQPQDAGAAQPVNNMGFQPQDAGAAQPVNNMGFQPQDAGAAQPVNNMGFQPQDAGAAQPVNNMGFTPQNFGAVQSGSPDMSSQFAQINQQNMQQFNNNPGFNQPVTPAVQPNGKKPKKQKGPKKPLSGGAIAGIITAVAAVIALVVCGIIFLPKMFKSPKDKVKDAFEKTFKTSENAVDFNKKLLEEGGEIKIGAKIDNLAGEDFPVEYNVDVIYAPKDKLVNADVDLLLSGDDILNLKLVGTENDTYISAPDIIDAYFKLPNDDFANKLANSEIGQLMELDASQLGDMSINYFDISADAAGNQLDIADNIWKKSEVKKGKKATVTVNGKSVKAQKFTVTIPTETILNEVESAAGDTLDELVKESGMSISSLNSSIAKALGENIVADVYVNDGKVVKVECKGNEMISYDLWLDCSSDEISGEITFGYAGENIVISLDIKDPEGNPNGNVKFNFVGEVIDVNFNSTIVDKNDEQGATINLDVIYSSQTLFKGSISVNENLNNKSASNVDSSAQVYDVCSMSQDDLISVVSDNMYSINEWATNVSQNPILSSMLGGLSGDIGMEDDWDDDWDDDYDDDWEDDWEDDYDYDENDMILSEDGVDVEILGSLDGLECTYKGTYTIEFTDDSYDFDVDYSLESSYWYDSPLELASEMYIPEDDEYSTYEFPEQEIGGSIEFEGTTVYYSKLHIVETYKDSDWSSEYIRYIFVREVADGVYLEAELWMYPDSDKYNLTTEELVKVVSSEYFAVK